MKLKILISQRDLSIGGIQNVLINFLNRIDYKKYEVDLLLLGNVGNINLLPKDVNVLYLKSKKVSILKKILLTQKKYKKQFVNNKIQLNKRYHIGIAFNGYDDNSDYIILNSQVEKKIIFVHGNYDIRLKNDFKFRLLWRNNKIKFKEFDKIICVSKSSKKSFVEILPNLKEKVKYIYNFLDEKELKVDNSLEEVLLDKKKKILLVGRMVKSKGFERVVDICLKLNDSNVLFIIIGDGPEKRKLENELLKKGLNDSIKILGFKNNVSRFFKKADMTLITSSHEGFGMTVLESIKEKTPVIAPLISGIIDIYEDIAPKNSMRICKNTNIELVEQIREELKNPQKNKFKFDVFEYNEIIANKYNQIIFQDKGERT